MSNYEEDESLDTNKLVDDSQDTHKNDDKPSELHEDGDKDEKIVLAEKIENLRAKIESFKEEHTMKDCSSK